MTAAHRYRLAPGWVVEQSNESKASSALIVSGHGRYLHVSGRAAALLSVMVAQPVVVNDHCIRKTHSTSTESSPFPLNESTLQRLIAYGIIIDDANDTAIPVVNRMPYLTVHVPILSIELVRRLGSYLAPLYTKRLVFILLPTFLALHTIFWMSHFDIASSLLTWPGSVEFGFLVGANYVGLLLHEVGHASACIRSGARPNNIGVGIYLVFPSFYTDVSDAWRLPRILRMVVDSAGVYTTLILSTIMIAMYGITRGHVWLLTAALYDISVIINVNPFVRMDAYWLLSDLLGIPNLMAMNLECVAWMISRVCGRHNVARPQLFRLPTIQRRICAAYCAASAICASFFAWQFVSWFLPRYLLQLPYMVRTIRISFYLYGLGIETLAEVWRFALVVLTLISALLLCKKGCTFVFKRALCLK